MVGCKILGIKVLGRIVGVFFFALVGVVTNKEALSGYI
jgi:hypothetical protein